MALGFDLVVIGSGPGSRTAAQWAARKGLKTGLVAPPGARGLVPLLPPLPEISSWDDFRLASLRAAASARQQQERLLEQAAVQVIPGTGRLDGPGRILVEGGAGLQEISVPRVILAPSSQPARPARALPDGQRILFPEDFLQHENLPRAVTVVGAGTVGCAWATILSHLGGVPTLVEVQEQVLPGEDRECVAVMTEALKARGVRLLTRHRLASAQITATGVGCQLKDLARNTLGDHHGPALLLAVGHQPAHRELGLDTVNVVQDRQGHILTDLMMQTATPGLYAIGDAVPSPRLDHLAQKEAMVAVEHAAGGQPEPLRYHLAPRSHDGPVQLAAVGFREDQALAAGHLITVGRAHFSSRVGDSADAQLPGLAKVVVDAETDQVLGVHLVGPQVSTLLPEAATVVGLGSKLSAWARVQSAMSPEQQVLQEAVLAAARGGS